VTQSRIQSIGQHSQKEASKLAHKKTDWNLPGSGGMTESRTRKNPKKNRQYKDSSESSNSEGSFEDVSSTNSDGDEDDIDGAEEEEVECMGVIVEVDSLQNLIKRNTKCPECGGKIQMLNETVTLATSWRLECLSKECSFIDYADSLAAARLPHINEDGHQRSTNFAVNALYVLGVIANGDGPTEAARLLGFLGLPRALTMEGYNFTVIEDRLAPAIAELNEEILYNNLQKEVKATVSASEYEAWQNSLSKDSPFLVLEKKSYPKIRPVQ
jgi:hypothetical protein